MSDAGTAREFETPLAEVRARWGWFIALGIVLLVLGVIAMANLLLSTVASILIISVMMIVGGIAHIVEAFGVRRWGRFFLWLLCGIAYVAAGIMAFTDPILASAVLTLVLAVFLAAAGALRIVAALGARPETGWGWLLAGGIVTLITGIIIALGWPGNSLWVLGLFLAIDLLFQGWSDIAFGLALRARR